MADTHITVRMIAAEILHRVKDDLLFMPNPAIAEWRIECRDLFTSMVKYTEKYTEKLVFCTYDGVVPGALCGDSNTSAVVSWNGIRVIVHTDYLLSYDEVSVKAWVAHDGPPMGAAFPEAVLLRGLAA